MKIRIFARQVGAFQLVGVVVLLAGFNCLSPLKVRHEARRLSSFAAKNLLRQSFEISLCPETHHQTR